jgi:hypothetical protein
VLFLLSLLAAYVLFKVLDSRATIRRRGWSAGGAIAGFLIILFWSWDAIRPTLAPLARTMPVSVPVGFKPLDVSDMGIAIAVPDDWERKPHPTEIFLGPKQHQQNSRDAMFIMISIQACRSPLIVAILYIRVSRRMAFVVAGQKLQSHRTVQARVERPVNDTHTPSSELFQDSVVREGFPRHRKLIWLEEYPPGASSATERCYAFPGLRLVAPHSEHAIIELQEPSFPVEVGDRSKSGYTIATRLFNFMNECTGSEKTVSKKCCASVRPREQRQERKNGEATNATYES